MPFSLEDKLLPLQDSRRAAFNARLAPTIPSDRFLGIKTPDLKTIAKSLDSEQKEAFLTSLPHTYVEEDIIHVQLLNEYKDLEKVRSALMAFLPYIQSWYQTDGLTFPRLSTDELLELAQAFLDRPESYARRLGIFWIMKRTPKLKLKTAEIWLKKALAVVGDQREIQLAKAWLLCEFMIHQPELAMKVLTSKELDPVLIRMAIGKCIDSRRIDEPTKQTLRKLRSQLS